MLKNVNYVLLKKAVIKKGLKARSYSVTIKSDVHTEQEKFQESDYFKEKVERTL